jgi:hypothetical protein
MSDCGDVRCCPEQVAMPTSAFEVLASLTTGPRLIAKVNREIIETGDCARTTIQLAANSQSCRPHQETS